MSPATHQWPSPSGAASEAHLSYDAKVTVYELLSGLLSVGTLAVVIVSLVMLRHQLRIMSTQSDQLWRSLRTTAETGLDSLFVAVTQAYLDHPELRRVFHRPCSVTEDLDADTIARAEALAETLADSMERTLSFPDLGLARRGLSLEHWIEDSLRDSDFFRNWLLTHKSWYSDKLVSMASGAQQMPVVRQ